MHYVLDCKRCGFIANASNVRSLGVQLNAHASRCQHELLIVIKPEDKTEIVQLNRDDLRNDVVSR